MSNQLKPIASLCGKLIICPTIYETTNNTYVVQGNILSQDFANEIKLSANENAIEIPKELIDELIKKIQNK